MTVDVSDGRWPGSPVFAGQQEPHEGPGGHRLDSTPPSLPAISVDAAQQLPGAELFVPAGPAPRRCRKPNGRAATKKRSRSIVKSRITLPQPTIAAVNGPAVGAGFGLVMACDTGLASPFAAMSGELYGAEAQLATFAPDAGVQ